MNLTKQSWTLARFWFNKDNSITESINNKDVLEMLYIGGRPNICLNEFNGKMWMALWYQFCLTFIMKMVKIYAEMSILGSWIKEIVLILRKYSINNHFLLPSKRGWTGNSVSYTATAYQAYIGTSYTFRRVSCIQYKWGLQWKYVCLVYNTNGVCNKQNSQLGSM